MSTDRRTRWERAAADVLQLSDRLLPLNRKERYYTATVLPMIVGANEFAHLDRFLSKCGVARGKLPDAVQFLTEYNFTESLFLASDRARFKRPPPRGGCTPDIVLCGQGWLVAVEAKLFDRPTREELEAQLRHQGALLAFWASELGFGTTRHVTLLTEELAGELVGAARNPLPTLTITWEELWDTYEDVAPRYWLAVLAAALLRYEQLRSTFSWLGRWAEAELSGAEILNAFQAGNCAYRHVGRRGGRAGLLFWEDVRSGGWRARRYLVSRADSAPSVNWFSIEEFVEAVDVGGRAQ